MFNQYGGLKLRDSSKRGFEAISYMINQPSSTLKLLTYSSLKGFMVILDVNDPNDSQYYSLKNGRFTNVVSSYLLKFAVISPNNDDSLPAYKTVNKSTESADSYFEEAKLQQTIWKRSIVGNREEICPPVGNLSIFEHDDSEKLLDFLINVSQSQTNDKLVDMFSYLKNQCISPHGDYGIGVIMMPNIQNSTTFYDFTKKIGTNFNGVYVTDDVMRQMFNEVVAKIVRLFIEIGVIHFDLHVGNILVYVSPKRELKCLIIDFGRASMIDKSKENNVTDEYLDKTQKDDIADIMNRFYNDFLDRRVTNKANIVKNVMQFIKEQDNAENNRIFGGYTDPDVYQMGWYEYYKSQYPESRNSEVAEILERFTLVENGRMSMNTIIGYENKGILPNFESKNATDFIVPFNIPSALPPTAMPLPAAMPPPAAMPLTPPLLTAQQPPTTSSPECQEDENGNVPIYCNISGGRRSRRKRHSSRRKRHSSRRKRHSSRRKRHSSRRKRHSSRRRKY